MPVTFQSYDSFGSEVRWAVGAMPERPSTAIQGLLWIDIAGVAPATVFDAFYGVWRPLGSSGSISTPYRASAVATTLLPATDGILEITSASAVTIPLTTPAIGERTEFLIIPGVGAVTLDPAGAVLVDGAATASATGPTTLVWTGSAWKTVPYGSGGTGGTPEVPLVFENPVGAYGRAIYCGPFWPTNSNLGRFFWEAWVCPLGGSGGSGQYWLSEDYGGNHALLVSPINGNIYNGSASTPFTSSYTPADGEWIHSAVSWDGTNIFMYVNGIVTCVVAFAGPRRAQADLQGALYLAGSDHNNLHGRLAAVRGWEVDTVTLPRPYYLLNNGLAWPFEPDRSFAPYGNWFSGGFAVQAQYAADLTIPAQVIRDYGAGYGGRTHDGLLLGTDQATGGSRRPSGLWVRDPTCPLRNDIAVIPARTVPTAPATPSGAKVFDSFSRAASILCWQAAPSLGSTETGSLGPVAWQIPAEAAVKWGVFDGRAVFQGSGYGRAWVATGSDTQDVRVDRHLDFGLHETGLMCRVTDGNNHFAVFTSGAQSAGAIVVDQLGGVGAGRLATWAAPATAWQTLRAVFSGTTLTVFCDATQVGQLTGVTAHQTAQGAGLYSYWDPSTARRWDNFTVI